MPLALARSLTQPETRDDEGAAAPITVLGKREREVLCLLAMGRQTLDIAREMTIAPGTVNVHRRNVKSKLGLRSTAALTRYAIREGLLSA